MILQPPLALLLLNTLFTLAFASKGSQSLVYPPLDTLNASQFSLAYPVRSQPRSLDNEAESRRLNERALADGGITFPPSDWFNIVRSSFSSCSMFQVGLTDAVHRLAQSHPTRPDLPIDVKSNANLVSRRSLSKLHVGPSMADTCAGDSIGESRYSLWQQWFVLLRLARARIDLTPHLQPFR